jgi:OmcA/MtrC family decaheme c-type cytochrome
MGDDLTLTGGAYAAVDAPYDVTFPQDAGHCAKCHNTVAQANNFQNKPSRRACGACHDDISFLAAAAVPAKRKAHSGGPMADDSNCTLCHPPTGPVTKAGVGVVDAHMTVAAPDPLATWLGGTNANTNAGYVPAAGFTPTGEVQLSYNIKSVGRDVNKNPNIVFRFPQQHPAVGQGGAGGVQRPNRGDRNHGRLRGIAQRVLRICRAPGWHHGAG